MDLTIKAITFDFWATLYKSKTVDYNKRLLALKELVEQYSGATFSVEQFGAAMKLARRTWGETWETEHRTMTADEWLEIMLAKLEATLNADHRLEIKTQMEDSVLTNLPVLAPDAQAVLPELAAHYRLGVISDTGLTPGRVLRQILEKDGIIGYFSQLTFSDEVGRSKPHPQAFLITLEALEAQPREGVHVGDLLRTDIAGAQQVGMRAVQYVGITQGKQWSATGGDVPAPAEIRPDAVIESHAELKPLLQQWNGTGPA